MIIFVFFCILLIIYHLFHAFHVSDQSFPFWFLWNTSEDHFGAWNHFLWVGQVFVQIGIIEKRFQSLCWHRCSCNRWLDQIVGRGVRTSLDLVCVVRLLRWCGTGRTSGRTIFLPLAMTLSFPIIEIFL